MYNVESGEGEKRKTERKKERWLWMMKSRGQTTNYLLQDTDICQQELTKSTETWENPKKLQWG
jgi:hypothetical protein